MSLSSQAAPVEVPRPARNRSRRPTAIEKIIDRKALDAEISALAAAHKGLPVPNQAGRLIGIKKK